MTLSQTGINYQRHVEASLLIGDNHANHMARIEILTRHFFGDGQVPTDVPEHVKKFMRARKLI